MTNCDSIFNLLLIFETLHPFSINFASDRKELRNPRIVRLIKFAQEHKDLTVQRWKKVMWSDV